MTRTTAGGLRLLRACVALVPLLVASALVATPAHAGTTTIGSDLSAAPTFGLLCAPSCSVFSPQIDGASTASPVSGVIVRWRVRAADVDQTALRVFRPVGGGNYDGVGTSATVLPTANAISTFDTQLPIEAGDFIGIDIGSGGPNYFNDTDATDSRMTYQPKLADGDPPAAPFATQAQREVLVNADIEPDADNDGFGDETQDGCPTDPTTQGSCPPKPSTPGTCAGLTATTPGTPASETIVGTPGDDVIVAGGGDDVIKGLGGNDVICGGDGNDKLKGGAGKDRIFGAAGRDKMRGGTGRDDCDGGPGLDSAKSC